MLIQLFCTALLTLATMREPGERLVVSGRVFDPSGTKPVAGVLVHAYHTDAKGYYNEPGKEGHRLSGNIKTDADGRFELHTIRPGSYPGRTDPAHIHLHVSGAGYPKQSPDAIEFADDPKVRPSQLAAAKAKGKFCPIVTPKRDARGVWRAAVNVRLTK